MILGEGPAILDVEPASSPRTMWPVLTRPVPYERSRTQHEGQQPPSAGYVQAVRCGHRSVLLVPHKTRSDREVAALNTADTPTRSPCGCSTRDRGGTPIEVMNDHSEFADLCASPCQPVGPPPARHQRSIHFIM